MSFKITDTVLDKLGFTKYWGGPGDYGSRKLLFSNGKVLEITDFDEKDDDTDGYTSWGTYSPQHFDICQWQNKEYMSGNNHYELLILSDLHAAIKECWSDCEEEFVNKCKKLKMDWGLIGAKDRYHNV